MLFCIINALYKCFPIIYTKLHLFHMFGKILYKSQQILDQINEIRGPENFILYKNMLTYNWWIKIEMLYIIRRDIIVC